ncbi:MAG: hypothetical protein CME59_05750 [Halioglobus sp.]|nr:hypothetical protein [Halioglobus sp.]
MFNKKMLTVAVATALTAGISAVPAQALEVSGNVALTTDYKFRGISQSDESAAIQGGFDVSFEPGFYVGTWGSSVDFDDDGSLGSLELDYYAGWSGNIGDSDFGIDVGYLFYDYPGDDGDSEGDYQEFYGSVSWKDLTVGAAYSDDYYAETDEFWYVYGDFSFPLLDALTVGLHVGYNMIEEGEGFLSSDEDAYTDYKVGVTYSWSDIDFELAWVGTDLDDDDVFGTDWGDDAAVFTISRSM